MNTEPPNDAQGHFINIRWSAIVFATGLLTVWLWFCHELSFIALDYPLRLAGQRADYPASGSIPFFIGCGKALLLSLFKTSLVWGIPFALMLALVFVGFGVRSCRLRCALGIVLLFVPVGMPACFNVYQHLVWVKSVGGD
jgi:hypothetical protein